MSDLDNSKLKELMRIDPSEMTDEDMKKFFIELKDATLLLPLEFTAHPQLDVDNLEEGQTITLDEPVSFKIIKIDRNGLKALPLFTDRDALSKFGEFNAMKLSVRDIVDLIIEDGTVDEIILDMNTGYGIGFKADDFVLNFVGDYLKHSFDVDGDMKKYSVPFEKDTVLFLRSETPFMAEGSEDGIFSTDMPFGASMEDICNVDFEFLNKLYIPKGTIFLYLGNIIEDATREHDIFLAPKLKFQLVNQDGNTFEWKCIEQNVE